MSMIRESTLFQSGQRLKFSLVLDIATKNCVKGRFGSSEYAEVATLAMTPSSNCSIT